MIIESIISILQQAGINNIFPVVIPQGESLPAASIFVVGDNPNPTKKETSKINNLRIQISCEAKTYLEACTLEEEIKNVLDGYDGIVNELDITIDFDDSRDVPEPDGKTFHRSTDYKILQKPGVATYSLTFTVTGDGTALPGASIVMLGGYESKTTDGNGQAIYYNLQPGTYNFMIVYGGEVKRTDSITITNADATYDYNVGVYPVETLTHKYDPNVTFESGGTTYMRDLRGDKDLPVIGVDANGHTIYDFSSLGDVRLNKNAYVGNAFGLPAYYNYPLDSYFYYDSAHPYYWTLKDFHRYYIEKQLIDTAVKDTIFLHARAINSTELQLSQENGLLIYSQSLTGEDLSNAVNYIGIQAEFYGDNLITNLGGNNTTDFIDSNSDGLANDLTLRTGNPIKSIISYSGNMAQRIECITPEEISVYQIYSYFLKGKTYHFSFKFKGKVGLYISTLLSENLINLSENFVLVGRNFVPGSNISSQIRFYVNAVFASSNPNDFFEIDSVNLKMLYQNYYKP